MHDDEKQVIKKLANGDAAKEHRLEAAACALVQCAAQYAPGTADYAKYSALQAEGVGYTSEQAKLQNYSGTSFSAATYGGMVQQTSRLSDLHAKAISYGGECMDDTYRGTNAFYHFRCAKGHEWSARAHLVLAGTWCRPCAMDGKRATIEQMQAVARERGGRCLSETYVNNRSKLMWACRLGHVWSATPGTVINRKAWCPDCFRLRVTKNPRLRKRYDVDG